MSLLLAMLPMDTGVATEICTDDWLCCGWDHIALRCGVFQRHCAADQVLEVMRGHKIVYDFYFLAVRGLCKYVAADIAGHDLSIIPGIPQLKVVPLVKWHFRDSSCRTYMAKTRGATLDSVAPYLWI